MSLWISLLLSMMVGWFFGQILGMLELSMPAALGAICLFVIVWGCVGMPLIQKMFD